MVFVRTVTSVAGVGQRDLSPLVLGFRPAKIAVLMERAFPTQKPEAGGYHIGDGLSRFGNVSGRTHRQGLSPRSWLSFSPSAV
jgi:hypothetical protein